jgi:hypothetical protein
MQRSPIPEAATANVEEPAANTAAACCRGGALWGWSPPPLPAGTAFMRLVDRVQSRTGAQALAFFAAVTVLLHVGQFLPRRAIWPQSGWRPWRRVAGARSTSGAAATPTGR